MRERSGGPTPGVSRPGEHGLRSHLHHLHDSGQGAEKSAGWNASHTRRLLSPCFILFSPFKSGSPRPASPFRPFTKRPPRTTFLIPSLAFDAERHSLTSSHYPRSFFTGLVTVAPPSFHSLQVRPDQGKQGTIRRSTLSLNQHSGATWHHPSRQCLRAILSKLVHCGRFLSADIYFRR